MKPDSQSEKILGRCDGTARKLVLEVQTTLEAKTLNLGDLKSALVNLLEYLSSAEGRTEANCVAVDLYFTINDLWMRRNLPMPFHGILEDIAGALHDILSSPEIAANSDSTPEQLLKRAREVNA